MMHWSKLRWNDLYLPPTRFVDRRMDLPFLPPPYTSLLDDAYSQGVGHKLHNAQQYVALHSVKLQAGQADMPSGELGRPATPDPVLLPELLGGRIHTTNV